MKIALTKLRTDGDTQPRALLNQDVISEYTEAMMEDAQFPPIIVFHDSANYWIADGFHRFFAAKRASLPEIECDVRQGTLREAQLFSLGANAVHGLRRTNEDKRKSVLIMLNDLEWAEWSNREIGRACGVSYNTVDRIKKSMSLEQTERKYKDKHGNVSTMKLKQPSEVSTLKPMDQVDDSKMLELEVAHQELAAAHLDLAEANEKLLDRVAVAAMEGTPEEKAQAEETIASLRIQLKTAVADLNAMTVSRDQYQAKAAEMNKQINYWKRRAEKAEAQLEKAAA